MGAWESSDGISTSHLKDLKDVNEAIFASSVPIHANKAISSWCSNTVIDYVKDLLNVPKAILSSNSSCRHKVLELPVQVEVRNIMFCSFLLIIHSYICFLMEQKL